MPIEIKELHLNLHLNNASKDKKNADKKGRSSSELSENKAVVDSAVKQVLKILKEKEQR